MTEKIYTVRSGDYLVKIAGSVLGDPARWKEIAHMNALTHPYIIRPGQILTIPGDKPEVVEVQPPLKFDVVGKPAAMHNTAAAPASPKISPATVKLLLALGAALFVFNRLA